MNLKLPTFFLSLVLSLQVASLGAAEPEKFKSLSGPGQGGLGEVAQINVPVGYKFFDGKTTQALMEAMGEPTSGEELGLLSPTNNNFSVFFEFSEVGYVKDDDKDKLDADKLLASIKKGTESGNKQRVKAGNPPLEIIGWEIPPRYDEKTHNLEWAIRARSADQEILNYNTRLLGRKGVMEVVLVVDPAELQTTLPTYRELLAGFNYQGGQSYAEFRQGDKVAKYGLAALVVGGAAVGAAKLGLFATIGLFLKKAWKLVVLGVAAAAGMAKKMMGRKNTQTQ